MNQIRAGEAFTPETSTHTSAWERIRSRIKQMSTRDAAGQTVEPCDLPDGWLCELMIDESQTTGSGEVVRNKTSRRASNNGLLPITLDDYLQLLDASGRMLRDDKVGAIPAEFAPILERLGIRPADWSQLVDNYHNWFGHIVGASEKVARRAAQVGRRWFRGQSRCAESFG